MRQDVVGPHKTLRCCACSWAGDGLSWSVLHGVQVACVGALELCIYINDLSGGIEWRIDIWIS